MSIFSQLMGNAGVIPVKELEHTYHPLLTPNEDIEIGFKVLWDTFVFTNKRLILVNVQGLTGKKTEYMSIAYKSITRFAVETAGTFDLDGELKIWVSGLKDPITKTFDRKVNIYDVQIVLANHVLK